MTTESSGTKHRTLAAELAELEQNDPEVRAAAERLAAVPEYMARTERWQAARRQVRGQS